ncbi:sensor domain-containing diguanylate cyclase [Massilia yuzhufengensis]|uniref:diguanylate cyclase n=1 Tax=Massilia yuzhufengensis TaxID=1164594 RepID=A0A1I1M3Q9_9BURK|nr:sensor domain-containing diguanylate cyclase [Massilia yuzhufengensis]SFC80004.1 diguanylate cyclase (GGDEF) domain-containing protein [Massilia yuzhufengensis]
MTLTPEPASPFTARAVNLANCGLVVLDAGQEIVLWNGWMVPRSGYSVARVRDRSLFEVFPELRGSRVESAVLAALTEEVATTVPPSTGRSPFPLREAGSFDGARIEQSVSVTPFSEAGERYCLVEIRDVSGVVDRERRLLDHAESLRARSYVDGLTGIANRRHFDVALDRELRRAQRNGGALSLLLMDIDSFKAYNDHFGHQEGDACLTTVAQALAGMLKRPADVAARYGGEEFAAILPDTAAGPARVLANAIREHVAALGLPHAPAALRPHVTLSIGVASFDPGRLDEPAALIEAADKALYAAKRGGRDRVVMDGEADVPA